VVTSQWFDGVPPVDVVSAHEFEHDRMFDGSGQLQVSESENVHRYPKGDSRVFGDWIVFHTTSVFGPYPNIVRLKVIEGAVYLALGFTMWLRLDSCRWAPDARFHPIGADGLPADYIAVHECAPAEAATLRESISNHALDLYNAMLTMIRQHAGRFPIGHDAIVNGRRVLACASRRAGKKINWANERRMKFNDKT
jgi:hypothetical protein